MPAIVVAVAGSLASYGVTYALGTGIFATIAAGLAGAVVSGVMARALAPSQKKASIPSVAQQDQGYSTITRSSVEPMRVIYGRRKLSGNLVFVHTSQQGFASQANLSSYAPTLVTDSRDNAFLHMVIALAAHECEAVDEIYLDDTLMTLDANGYATNSPFQTNYVDGGGNDNGLYRFARAKVYLGTEGQTADNDLKTIFSGWTDAHRLRGTCYLYICLRWYDRVFPNGIPNVSAVVRGKKVYDPRTATTAYSNNWALCARDYLTDSFYGLGCTSAEIDDTSVIAAANISDEDVSLLAGGTQKRYTCDGVIDTSNAPLSVLDSMSSAAGGVITYSQGQFQIYAGAYASPTQTLDASWLRNGSISMQARTPRRERFNAVRGVYTDPTKLWQPTDFPAIADATYAAQDSETIYRDLDLPFTTESERAQRLARLYLEQNRRGITCSLQCNLKALNVRVWDTINVTLDDYGWAAKPFRVVAWRMSADGGIDLELREDDSNVYSWTTANATNLPSVPSTNLPLPTFVAAPGTPSIVEEVYTTTDGSGVKVRVNVSWGLSTGPFVYRYRLEYKLSSETAYRLASETSATSARLEDVAPGTYNFRVKAINTILAESDYSAVTTTTLAGLTAPPADITGLTLNELKGTAHLEWNQSSDLDVRIGGAIRVRYSPQTSSATWSSAVDIGPRLPGIATNVTLPLLTGTYLIKAVDSVGTESVNATTISSNLADLLAMNVVVEDNEHSTFSGTKTNMSVDGTTLQLASNGAGGFETSGEYVFSTSGGACIDLKQVLRCRLTANIAATIYRSADLWDSASGLWDDASGLFDGADVTGVSMELYVRTTNDDPAGTPTWSEWRKFLVGDYENRAFQFKLLVTSDDSAKNVDITTLGVAADVPDRDEKFYDVAVGTGGTTTSFSNPFYTKPSIVAVIQSMAAGDTCVLSYTTSGGKYASFTATCYNLAGIAVARTCDFHIRGY